MFGSENTQEAKRNFEVKVIRAKELKGKQTAMFDMEVNGVTIYGLALHENKKDDKVTYSVTFPSTQDKADPKKYWKICYFPITSELISDIAKQVGEKIKE